MLVLARAALAAVRHGARTCVGCEQRWRFDEDFVARRVVVRATRRCQRQRRDFLCQSRLRRRRLCTESRVQVCLLLAVVQRFTPPNLNRVNVANARSFRFAHRLFSAFDACVSRTGSLLRSTVRRTTRHARLTCNRTRTLTPTTGKAWEATVCASRRPSPTTICTLFIDAPTLCVSYWLAHVSISS